MFIGHGWLRWLRPAKGRIRPCLCYVLADSLGRISLSGFVLIWGRICISLRVFFVCLFWFAVFWRLFWVGEISLLIISGFSRIPFANDRHEDEAECVHYVTGPTGTRVGCHFDELGEPQGMDNYFFLLNGTSRESAIPFLDFVPFKARNIGKRLP